MGLRSTQGDKKRRGPATTLYSTLPFPCHPDRTWISCHAALDMAAFAAFVKEAA